MLAAAAVALAAVAGGASSAGRTETDGVALSVPPAWHARAGRGVIELATRPLPPLGPWVAASLSNELAADDVGVLLYEDAPALPPAHLEHNRLSILTPLYASGLVLISELADASIPSRWTPETRRAVLQRVVRAFGGALAALVLTGALVLFAREVTLRGSWLGPIGLLAVSALLIVVVALTREIAPARSAGDTGLAPTRRT